MSGVDLLIDWLGRGGIAQTSWAWLAESGRPLVLVTRADRDLVRCPAAAGVVTGGAKSRASSLPGPLGTVVDHGSVVAAAVRSIADHRPRTVVVQNHIVPALEASVARECHRVGSRFVLVIHDHRLHTITAGIGIGLSRLIRSADVVVAHSHFVADAVAAATGRRDLEVLPLPVPVGMPGILDAVGAPAMYGDLLAVHFGVVHRRYKGTDVVRALAARGQPGWSFSVVGVGARPGPGLSAVDRYLDDAELVEVVESSTATLLPYRMASQSGAVTVAQARGSIAVAADVGGLAEQIDHGVDGLLIPATADVDDWADALASLRDEDARSAIVSAARARVERQHHQFRLAVRELLA